MLPAPPAADKLVRAVARAKIESALFATAETIKVGRYHLLEMVGAGGMGVVWGAYDPELDRRVAIKLVAPELGAARDRILAEGQALAKLAHPNVVAVHDVGLFEEQIYIVMEWVRGENLRAWSQTAHTILEIVTVYLAAGEGLSAAHRAALVHRDFKPENAIVGEDGRVRVLDFGLARGVVDAPAAGSIAGTPRYMPPEQLAGGEITERVDQYAFATALRETLEGRNADKSRAPVPAWLDAIISRATASEPADRYPSIDEMLRALERDPARVWRRRILAGAALAAVAGAFAIGSARSTNAVEPCVGGQTEIEGTWNAGTRTRLLEHLGALGPYAAHEAPRLAPAIDAYGQRWASAHHNACMAAERRELTPQLYERNTLCLERSKAAFATVLEVMASAPAERLPDAVLAFHSLPDVDRCLADTRASTLEPPSSAVAADVAKIDRKIEQARIRALSADPSAVADLAALAEAAAQVGYLPVVARANLVHGVALNRTGQTDTAIPVLARAMSAALEAGDDVTVVEAFARSVYAFAVTAAEDRPTMPDPFVSLAVIEPIAKRLRATGSFVRPLLFMNLGIARMAAQDEPGARTWFSRARDDQATSHDASIELMFIPSNLALAVDAHDEQQHLIEDSAARFEATLGPGHPLALEFRVRAAMFEQHPIESAKRLAESCGQFRRLHPHQVIRTNDCTYEEGWLADERGDATTARAAYQAIRPSPSPGDAPAPKLRIARVRLLALDGKHEQAAREARTLATELEAAPSWWLRVFAADAYLVAAASNDQRGAAPEALADLQRARTILEEKTIGKSQTYHQRRLARVRLLLARRLGSRDLAAAAATWYRAAGGYDAAVAELDTIAR